MACRNSFSARSESASKSRPSEAPGLWEIEADANHLESAIVNLAINARDAMPDGGKLTLEAANISADDDYCRLNPELAPGQYVAICVTDTGGGMTPRRSQSRL